VVLTNLKKGEKKKKKYCFQKVQFQVLSEKVSSECLKFKFVLRVAWTQRIADFRYKCK